MITKYEKTMKAAKEFYYNMITENYPKPNLDKLVIPTSLVSDVFNHYVTYRLLVQYPGLRYTNRKEFVSKCYKKVMVKSLRDVLSLNDEYAAKFITKYTDKEADAASFLFTMYCRSEYGDVFDEENWKTMINAITERSFKLHTLKSFVIDLQENIKPILFGAISTGLIVWNILMR